VDEEEEENNGTNKENHIRKNAAKKANKNYDIRGLLEKYSTFGREKETGLLGALDRRERTKIENFETKIENFMNTKYELKEKKREVVPVQAIKSYRESGSLSPFILKLSARLK